MFLLLVHHHHLNSDLKLNSIQCSENTGRQCRVLIVVFTESSPNQVQQRQFIKSIFLGARILRNENNTHLEVDALANKLKSSKDSQARTRLQDDMITCICLKSSRANKDHPRNGPLMVSNNVPMKEYDSMLSPNWGEIRALALYEMTRGPNETPRHLIFAFLLLILFIHSRGK